MVETKTCATLFAPAANPYDTRSSRAVTMSGSPRKPPPTGHNFTMAPALKLFPDKQRPTQLWNGTNIAYPRVPPAMYYPPLPVFSHPPALAMAPIPSYPLPFTLPLANGTSQKRSFDESTAAGDVREGKKSKPDEDEKWEEQYRILCAYHDVHGDCNVPNRYARTFIGRPIHFANSASYLNSVDSQSVTRLVGGQPARLLLREPFEPLAYTTSGSHWFSVAPASGTRLLSPPMRRVSSRRAQQKACGMAISDARSLSVVRLGCFRIENAPRGRSGMVHWPVAKGGCERCGGSSERRQGQITREED